MLLIQTPVPQNKSIF